MTEREALNEILNSAPRKGTWYRVSEDDAECTWYRITALRMLNNTAKIENRIKFFNHFGYTVKIEVEKNG